MAAKNLREDSHAPPLKKVVAQSHDSHDDDGGWAHASPKKGEEGEGPWLISYADMMTLLMGFFALIASFSKPDAKEFDKVAAASSQYFGGKYEAPYEKLGQSLMRTIKENKLEDQVKIEVGPGGVTMTFTGTLFFDSGDYKVKPDAIDLMDKLSATIKKTGTVYMVMIEGHTDDAKITHPIIASNWELSGIRAARIAQLFENKGFDKKQLTIMGWGETKPVVDNFNADGTPNVDNRAKNRRVVIRVYKDLPQ
jgi:chemotaxis protein MotB